MIDKITNPIPVAVLGATGSVGQRFVQLLDGHPWFKVAARTGSKRSVGKRYGEYCHWILTEAMPDGAGLTLSEIRELLGTTRKYAVPICEYLDRIGFTSRDGDLRRLKQAPVKESDGVGS